MAVVYADRTIEVAVIQDYAARPVVNVWHMQLTEEWWPASAEDVAQDFANNWQDHVVPLQSNELEVLRFDWRSLDQSNGAVGTIEPDPAKPYVGENASPCFPPNVALLVHKRTENRPRGRRDGRMFLAGIGEAAADARGSIDPAYVASYTGYMTQFYNGISDTGVFTNNGRYPVVLETTPASRAPGTNPVTVNTRRVTSLSVDTLISTQRDRLR